MLVRLLTVLGTVGPRWARLPPPCCRPQQQGQRQKQLQDRSSRHHTHHFGIPSSVDWVDVPPLPAEAGVELGTRPPWVDALMLARGPVSTGRLSTAPAVIGAGSQARNTVMTLAIRNGENGGRFAC